MIEYIKGELTELTPAYATVEAAGVGYGLNISLITYTAIQNKKEVKLWVFEASVKTLMCFMVFLIKRNARCSCCSSR